MTQEFPNIKRPTNPISSTKKSDKLIRKPFSYDAQFKRYMIQILAMFSGYQVRTGNQRDGKIRFLDVPVVYGDMSRVGGYLLNGGNENILNTLPVMAITDTGFRRKQDWVQNPTHREKYSYIERRKDTNGKFLIGVPGEKKTVERFMPVPYDLAFQLSIWAPNNDQGWQLAEQIAQIFNPRLEILVSNSPVDWGAVSSVLFEGEVHKEKEIPTGTDIDPAYVFNLNFSTEIYLSPPVKVYETKYIYNIQIPIRDLDYTLEIDEMMELDKVVIKATDEEIMIFEQATKI